MREERDELDANIDDISYQIKHRLGSKIFPGHTGGKYYVEMSADKYAGRFVYVVYRLMLKLFTGRFWTRALGIGCLVCVILELYRKEHAKYENLKIEESGDVT